MAHKKNTEVRASKSGKTTFTKDMKTGRTTISNRGSNGKWKDSHPKRG